MKILTGIFGRSTAIISDAVNSIGDVATAIAVVDQRRSSPAKRSDDDHPVRPREVREHGQSIFIGVALIVSAFEIGKSRRSAAIYRLSSLTAIRDRAADLHRLGRGLRRRSWSKEIMYRFTKKAATRSAASPAFAGDGAGTIAAIEFAAAGVHRRRPRRDARSCGARADRLVC
ncbi:MAG: hypothetical protein MZU97_24495 [Bacillus subtilis]|nr:hypothetical protein [Bacillus subtilis]